MMAEGDTRTSEYVVLPTAVCRHCQRHLVLTPVGWRLTAHYIPPEKYHDEAAWMACEAAPKVLGFVGRHVAQDDEAPGRKPTSENET